MLPVFESRSWVFRSIDAPVAAAAAVGHSFDVYVMSAFAVRGPFAVRPEWRVESGLPLLHSIRILKQMRRSIAAASRVAREFWSALPTNIRAKREEEEEEEAWLQIKRNELHHIWGPTRQERDAIRMEEMHLLGGWEANEEALLRSPENVGVFCQK